MTDVHALSGAYALDALDDIERAAFERHLAECAACRAEVASLRETAALIAETTAIEPPAALRSRVLAGIATVRPLPPVVPEPVVAETRTRPRRFRLAALAAAAAVIAVVSVGGAVWNQVSDDSSQTLTGADAVLSAADAKSTSLDFDGGATPPSPTPTRSGRRSSRPTRCRRRPTAWSTSCGSSSRAKAWCRPA